MSKLTRKDLKELVKECLFEILLEASDKPENLPQAPKKKLQSQQVVRPKSFLDNMVVGPAPQNASRQQSALDVSQITSDPVMEAIFKDTAKTTLVEQNSAERNGAKVSQPSRLEDPKTNEVFGNASKNWEFLAFGN
jgi:hypothetical protein